MKSTHWKLGLLAGITLAGLTGCGSSRNNNDNTQTTTATVSGQLQIPYGGTSFSTKSSDPSNYILWIQNRGTGESFQADIHSDGTFELDIQRTDDIAAGDNFIATLIQKEPLEFAGTILIQSTPFAATANTGIGIIGNLSNMSINFDPTTGRAVFTNPSQNANLEIKSGFNVNLDGAEGPPIGFGNQGKGADSVVGLKSDANIKDNDQDGIPDIFDAMNDGESLDNKVSYSESAESLKIGPKFENFFIGSSVGQMIMFMNLKVDNEDRNDADLVTDNAIITIELHESGSDPITEVRADLLNTNWKSSKIEPLPGGFTDLATPTSYPAQGSYWSSPNYLYKARNQNNQTVWTTMIKPDNGTFRPGNLIRFKVTKSSGKVEYHWKTINFKFISTVTVDSAPTVDTGTIMGAGSRDSLYEISPASNLSISWSHPNDENGNPLTGLTYRIELFHYDANRHQVGIPQVLTVSGIDPTSFTIPSANIDMYNSLSPNPAYIQADITASYPYGDNAASKIFIRRSNWPMPNTTP